MQTEYFALEGRSRAPGDGRTGPRLLQSAARIEGVVLTMYDERTNLGRQVIEDIRNHLGEKVFETVIPRNVRLGEAPSFGKPVLAYDIKSRGAEAYLALAREFLRRRSRPGDEPQARSGPRSFGSLLPGKDDVPRGTLLSPEVEIARLRPSRFQPRRDFSDAALAELASSIREQGIRPADRRRVAGRALRDRRGRAALAGRSAGRAPTGSRRCGRSPRTGSILEPPSSRTSSART